MSILAQSAAEETTVYLWDNAFLDSWEIPFGAWMDIIVSWTVLNLQPVLDVIEWPFSFLFRNFVVGPEYHPWWEITDMPWVLVCGIVLIVGAITRNLKVGGGLGPVAGSLRDAGQRVLGGDRHHHRLDRGGGGDLRPHRYPPRGAVRSIRRGLERGAAPPSMRCRWFTPSSI